MTLVEWERRVRGLALEGVRRFELLPNGVDQGIEVLEAALASRVIKALARRSGGAVATALYRTHRALLRELYHEGIITRKEAGMRAPRRPRLSRFG